MVGDISELPGSQGKKGNKLSLSLVRDNFFAVYGETLSSSSDGAVSRSQAYTAVLGGAPGPGIACVGQQQAVLSAVGTDEALSSQQVLSMEGHWWAGAATWCPYILKGLQW